MRRLTPRRRATALLATALLAVVAAASVHPAGADERSAVPHRAGGKAVAAGNAPTIEMSRLRHGAGEPTLGINREGHVFITASSGCVTSCVGSAETVETVAPGGRAVFVTKDRGRTWEDISPGVSGVSPHAYSLDPYLLVDQAGDFERMFDIDLTLACAELSYSDNGGESWVTNPIACGEPINDHQTLFTGVPVSSPVVGYPKVVYYCFNHPVVTKCTKSINGGLTFVPTTNIIPPECGGLNGHGVTDKKGVIYLPLASCGEPHLAISRDEGNTWEDVVVSEIPADSGGDPSVAVDGKGNLYYLYVDNERRPLLVTSKDGGKTWSTPRDVAAPGVTATNLATLDVGAPGKVAIAYYGTTEESPAGFWHGYLAVGTGVLGAKPLFYSATVDEPGHPFKAKGCGPGRCGRVLDFIDVEIGPDGAAWGAYVDACQAVCERTGQESLADNEGVVGTFVGGTNLNKA